MPDYKRLVSYMYNYEDGKKRNNVGYARVETRNGQCKYTIHITAPSLNDKQLKVYLFKREAENMEGVLLGTFVVKNGNGDFKAVTEAIRIKNTPYGLDEMGGIVLYYTEKKFFATEWDSKAVEMSKVYAMDKRELKKSEPASVVVDTQTGMKAAGVAGVLSQAKEEEKDKVKDKTNDNANGKINDRTNDKVNHKGNDNSGNVIFFKKESHEKDEKQIPNGDEPLKELLTPNLKHVIDTANKSLEEDLLSKELLENNKDLLQGSTKEKGTIEKFHTPKVDNSKAEVPKLNIPKGYATKSEEPKIDTTKIETPQAESSKPDSSKDLVPQTEAPKVVSPQTEAPNVDTAAFVENKESGPIVFEDHPLAKQIYKSFPRMYPFEDNEIAWSARIEPKDIGLLPTEYWGLGNNSFLLHGYYSYRHLIFARTNDKNGCSYILGIPGIYHNREKFMAKMFGFENFKCTKRKMQRTGEFGYWYIPIILS
ncbi:MAG: DUF6128 domain-containing protein [Anaerocolumna sp.]